MFFVISALLFGTRWVKDNYVEFQPVGFLKKRCSRIFIPLWISLLLVIPIEYVVAHKFVPSTILMNVIGLNWARPFGTAGHLWYITMLMILYVCFVGISRLRLDRIKWYWWLSAFAALVVSYFMLQSKLTTYSKAGPPLFTFFSVLMFARGKDVLEIAKKYRHLILVVTIAMVVVSRYVYQLGWHYSHKALAIGSFICAGFVTFLTLNSYLNVTKQNKAISWIAGISYEIYLVHLPLMAISSEIWHFGHHYGLHLQLYARCC